jgi:hypothetical protein
MVGNAESQSGLSDRDAAFGKLGESVKRTFMDVMAVYPQQRLAVVAPHDFMGAPQLVDDGLRLAHAFPDRALTAQSR